MLNSRRSIRHLDQGVYFHLTQQDMDRDMNVQKFSFLMTQPASGPEVSMTINAEPFSGEPKAKEILTSSAVASCLSVTRANHNSKAPLRARSQGTVRILTKAQSR